MQSPEGQREAPSAEHCPAQLTPCPQVASSEVLSSLQQVTLLEWLEKVKALSKKSTEGMALVSPGNHANSSSIQSLAKIAFCFLHHFTQQDYAFYGVNNMCHILCEQYEF